LETGKASFKLGKDDLTRHNVAGVDFRLADSEVGDQVGKGAVGRVSDWAKIALPSGAVQLPAGITCR
jgi:hypothetical protein